MTKISAATFAAQAEQFLGRPYSEMDCRELINRMLRSCGVNASYKGSNALWRDMAWTGTPEEAVKAFGGVPVGALIYILEEDGGEVARGYTDGLGNASHVGVKTGTGQGAIHSSASRGCVCESAFSDKTVKNGGWNRVGLLKQVNYGMEQPSEQTTVSSSDTAVVTAPSGSTVNLRRSASKASALVDRIPLHETVTLRGPEMGGWYPVRWGKKEGWVMAEYLRVSGAGAVPNWQVIFEGLRREEAEALAAAHPSYPSRIEGR